MAATLPNCLTALNRIAAKVSPRFDFTDGTRTRVRKGFTFEKGQGSGRPKRPDSYIADLARCLDHPSGLMFLYPGHYDLAVVDVDSPTASGILDFVPPLHHSQSRSGTERGGHLWYRRPRYSGDLKPLKPRSFTLRGDPYLVDIQYTQLLRVPSPEIPSVLSFIATYLDHTPTPLAFPYELLGLSCVKGERDTKWWHYILAQTEQLGDPGLVSRDRWQEVAEETGYFADGNNEQDFHETYTKATTKAQIDDTHKAIYPFDVEGATQILTAMTYRYRYNVRSGHTEIAKDNAAWQSIGHEMPRRWFVHSVRSTYRAPKTKTTTQPWDPLLNWSAFIDWLDTYAAQQQIYDPIAQHLHDWQDVEPLDNQTSFLLELFAPGNDTPLLAAQLRNVELNMLLTLYSRLHTGQATGVPAAIHFPYLPTLIGPPGCGKSRFCVSLGLYDYHTNDIRFDDPPKEFGEKAQIAVVAELEELKEMLGRQGSAIRGLAKKYINQTRFDYRAAFARGAKASTHHLMGMLVGTSNYPIEMSSQDGLWRRVIHMPIQRHPRFTGNLDEWDDVWSEWFPRAMARAARHYEQGKRPRIDETRIVTALHELIYSMEIVDHVWQARTLDGAEFD